MRGRPRFAVVTAVVTILAVLGALIQVLHPFLPPAPIMNDFSDRGGFMQQASQEAIHWLPLSDTDFLEAKQKGKPIFLFAGAEWNRDARIADRNTFVDPDIQALITSDYISVRIDCDESPEWLNAFFPVSRYDLDVERGCQGYFVSPDGSMFDYLLADAIALHRDTSDLTQAMLSGRLAMKNLARKDGPAAGQQVRDLNALMSAHPPVQPDFAAFNHLLHNSIDTKFGGFPDGQTQTPLPDVYRYALASHQPVLLQLGLRRLLLSPMVDWMDGGFFAKADRDWNDVHFDKITVANAGLMADSALYGVTYDAPIARRVATRTFDALAHDFVRNEGLLGSCRVGDETPTNRSKRTSLSEEDLRSFWNSGMLPEADRKWAVKYLNLDLSRNEQLIPWVSDPSVPKQQGAALYRVLNELRESKKDIRPRYSQIAYADVNGFAIARMLECARLWNDPERLGQALGLKHRLEMLRMGADVQHRPNQKHGGPELTDYLSYSDASLQAYLATGDVHSFNLGLQVLLEAKSLFELRTPGAWLMARSSQLGLPREYLAPEVADNLYESCTAREIRLMTAYSRLLQGNPDQGAVSAELDRDAEAAITQFAPAANSLGLHAAGYYCAALQYQAPVYAVAVGVRAVELAGDLYRLDPTLFAAPALGPVRPDLQARGDGIYLVRGRKADGPFADAVLAEKQL